MAIASQIRSAIEAGQSVDLAAMGEPHQIIAAVVELSDEVVGVDLFITLASQASQTPELWAAALALVDAVTDTGVMTEISSQIVSGIAIPLPVPLFQVFVGKCQNRTLHYGVRAQALRSALYLSQADRGRRGVLKGVLQSTDLADDGEYLKHVATVAGVLLAHTRDSDLQELLLELVDVVEAEDEAAQQLGMFHLNDALTAHTSTEVIHALQEAKSWFSRAAVQGEDRPDAELYGACVSMLVEFHEYKGRPTTQLQSHLNLITNSIGEYLTRICAHDARPNDLSWFGNRTIESLAWTRMSVSLNKVGAGLHDEVWMNAAATIESDLLDAWTLNRSIFNKKPYGGISEIIRPTIVGALHQDAAKLAMLERWIGDNANSAAISEAIEMRDAVRAALERSILRQNPKEAATESSKVVAETIPEGSDSEWRLFRQRLETFGASVELSKVEPIIFEIVENLRESLSKNWDFQRNAVVQNWFMYAVLVTLIFVRNRHDYQKDSLTSIGYLWSAMSTPHEKHMQKDYLQSFELLALGATASQEVGDSGGGRSDVEFAMNGYKFVNELKRTSQSMSLGELLDAYGFQVQAYLSTNVTLGMLMVLDLVDRPEGAGHIRDQVGVEFRRRPDAQEEYAIVVFRVQGNRRVPSNLKSLT